MKFNRLALSFSVLAAIASLALVKPVGAEGIAEGSAQGIRISPTLIELNAEKGKTYNLNLNVTNVANSDMQYQSSVLDFTAANELGTPRLSDDNNLPETASIKTWVSVDSKFTLNTQKTKSLVARITIPTNAEPGGHYGVIRFSGTSPSLDNNSAGVGLSASAGALILIKVDGDITWKSSIESFYTADNNKKQATFFESAPINFVTRVKNQGNSHIQPFGNIEIKDMFGSVVKAISINDNKSNVLPNSIRRFDSELKQSWMFGLYTANLSLGYGTSGQALVSTITFWVIPYKVVLAVLFVVFSIIFVITRMLKAYKKSIIKRIKNEDSKSKKHGSKKS